MDAVRFDAVAKRFAARRSRRRALAEAAAGLAAGTLAAAGRAAPARAQDAEDTQATPAATPPAGVSDGAPMMLFLQAFQGGSVAPKVGEEGRYTLTLEQGLGQTIYFSDRPERLVGATPTPAFLETLGFSADNPPNAALVVTGADGQTDVAVVELFAPSYEEATHTATYEAAVLAEWEAELGMGFTEAPADLSAFGERFGAAHLFIDGCPYGTAECLRDGVVVTTLPGTNHQLCIGRGAQAGQCVVCESTVTACNATRECSAPLGGDYCTARIVY